MKLVLASSLLSVLCFPEEAAAFTAARPKIAALRSSSNTPQTNIVALQAVANANDDNEKHSQQLNRRDALFRFAAAATTALVSGSQIAVAADEATADPSAIAELPSSTSAATSTSNTLSVAKEEDFKSAPPSSPPKDVEIKVAMEKSPANPVSKQLIDESKLVAKMEDEVKAPVAAKKEVELKVAALEKDARQEPIIRNETNLLAKITDDDADSASTLLLPGGKSVIKASFPSSVTTSIAAPAKTSSTVVAALEAPGKEAATVSSNAILGTVGIGAGLLALAAMANNEEEVVKLPTGTPPPTILPYGLDAGRVYGEAPPKPPAPASPLAPAPVPDPALIEAQEKWKQNQPTPYGIVNKNKNPFIKEMYENCEGGKVTEKCTETLTEYMEDIASTGAVASDAEVETIVSYMDSLQPTSSQKSTGAAIAGYLDALSVGTAPGPKNAKAVATYLDTLGGSSGVSVPKAFSPRKANPAPVAAKPAPVAAKSAPVVAPSPDFSSFDSRLKQIESQGSSTSSIIQQYDSRLTTIETRVTSLESKVDAIPDQVFQRMDAWQSKADLRLSEEVKKIIAVLTPEAQEPAAAPVAPTPTASASVASTMPPKPAPEMSSTPAAAAMSNPMLAGKAASAPKKGYGFGSGNWKKN